jgi:hypothetical protein
LHWNSLVVRVLVLCSIESKAGTQAPKIKEVLFAEKQKVKAAKRGMQ